jgi:hypothetical protein
MSGDYVRCEFKGEPIPADRLLGMLASETNALRALWQTPAGRDPYSPLRCARGLAFHSAFGAKLEKVRSQFLSLRQYFQQLVSLPFRAAAVDAMRRCFYPS